MKIFSWVQRKLSGKKHEPTSGPSQESLGPSLNKEVQGWPQDEETFLAIGTLGNNICPKEEDETDSSKDLTSVNTDVTMGKKKSLSFLLKKMFVCTSGFKTPPPLLDLSRGDSLPNTRKEKMLRTILKKKIHPQGPQRSNSTAKKYLENNHKIIDEARSSVDANKWVKTDSECEIF
ncbi:Protein LAZY 3 [Cardamine amara subsp. amara]|uniref:Protein LAZY 3 n=1 Tax=Cardamine amara subsp. amara TaxID=228776 RepID=A0ABD1AMB1_CARAN